MKGVYVLTVWLNRDVKKKIGALGEVLFEKGLYAYVGSAQKGIRSRVKRHLSSNEKLFWHIDYFLDSDFSIVSNVFFKEAGKSEECVIAKSLGGVPVKGFGCSDCSCHSHFFKIDNPKQIKRLGLNDFSKIEE